MKLFLKICIVFFCATFASSALAYYQQGFVSSPYSVRTTQHGMSGYYHPNRSFYSHPHQRPYRNSYYRNRYPNGYDTRRADYNRNRYNYDPETDTPIFQVVPGMPVRPLQRNNGIYVIR